MGKLCDGLSLTCFDQERLQHRVCHQACQIVNAVSMLCAAMGREERLIAFRLHEDRSIGSKGLKGTACKIRISPHRCRSQTKASLRTGWMVRADFGLHESGGSRNEAKANRMTPFSRFRPAILQLVSTLVVVPLNLQPSIEFGLCHMYRIDIEKLFICLFWTCLNSHSCGLRHHRSNATVKHLPCEKSVLLSSPLQSPVGHRSRDS